MRIINPPSSRFEVCTDGFTSRNICRQIVLFAPIFNGLDEEEPIFRHAMLLMQGGVYVTTGVRPTAGAGNGCREPELRLANVRLHGPGGPSSGDTGSTEIA